MTIHLLVDVFDLLTFLLQLHASVLEPNFDLAFRQTEGVSDLNSASSSQVVAELEFLFQFQRLETGVGLAAAATLH